MTKAGGLHHVEGRSGERGPIVNGGDQFKTCVCHTGSFLALTSVSTTWG